MFYNSTYEPDNEGFCVRNCLPNGKSSFLRQILLICTIDGAHFLTQWKNFIAQNVLL